MQLTLCLVIFASFLASIQGFPSKEKVLKNLEHIENSANEHLAGAKLVIEDGEKQIKDRHAEELKQSQLRNFHNTQVILREANKRKCPVQLQQEIFLASDSIKDTWNDCMNFSQQILNFQNFTFAVYNDILSWRPVICDVANNVSLCFGTDGFIKKVECLYESVVDSVDNLKMINSKVVDLIHDVNGLVDNIVDDFKLCFGWKEKDVKSKQLALLDMCPQSGEDLSSKLL